MSTRCLANLKPVRSPAMAMISAALTIPVTTNSAMPAVQQGQATVDADLVGQSVGAVGPAAEPDRLPAGQFQTVCPLLESQGFFPGIAVGPVRWPQADAGIAVVMALGEAEPDDA
jgi:hypothetical protein